MCFLLMAMFIHIAIALDKTTYLKHTHIYTCGYAYTMMYYWSGADVYIACTTYCPGGPCEALKTPLGILPYCLLAQACVAGP